jgi:hypothetical protein
MHRKCIPIVIACAAAGPGLGIGEAGESRRNESSGAHGIHVVRAAAALAGCVRPPAFLRS